MKLNFSKSQSGFTLMEVMVSLLILGVLTTTMATSFVGGLKFNNLSAKRSEAIDAAQQVLDELRIQDPTTMPTSGNSAPQNITIGSRTYSAVTSYCSPNTYCTSNNIRSITVTVSYKNNQLYAVNTIFSQLR